MITLLYACEGQIFLDIGSMMLAMHQELVIMPSVRVITKTSLYNKTMLSQSFSISELIFGSMSWPCYIICVLKHHKEFRCTASDLSCFDISLIWTLYRFLPRGW